MSSPARRGLSDLELEMVVGGKNDGAGKHLVGHGYNFRTII
ncbi:hypothetical protein [Pseudodesulfovibrio sp.]